MAFMGYMSITGASQGRIEGGGAGDDFREPGLIEVLAFDHAVELPRKGQASVAMGRAVHRDIEVVKLVDKASPKLYQALVQNEPLPEVKFEWFEQTGSGKQDVYYSILLKNALLTRMQPWMPDFLDARRDRYRFMEKLAMSYESILWSWGSGGDVQFEADWSGEAKA